MDKINVTEEEISTYYEANKQDFTTPAEITLREILIRRAHVRAGHQRGEDEAARAKAEEVRKRLLAGEPFPRLAAEVAGATPASGGPIGVRLDELTAANQKVLEPMKVGDVTPVVATTRGYQILKLESRSETKILPLDEASPAASRRIAEKKARGETHEVPRRSSAHRPGSRGATRS